MAVSWDDYSDDYEDESLDEVREILRTEPTAVTAPLLSVRDVAELLLERLTDEQVGASKLQSLCYLVQGRHLAITAVPAFGDPIYASDHGPFIDALATVGSDVHRIHGEARLAEKEQLINTVVTQVAERYGAWSSGQLRELIRNQAPWIHTWRAAKSHVEPAGIIPPALMRDYFAHLASVPYDSVD